MSVNLVQYRQNDIGSQQSTFLHHCLVASLANIVMAAADMTLWMLFFIPGL